MTVQQQLAYGVIGRKRTREIQNQVIQLSAEQLELFCQGADIPGRFLSHPLDGVEFLFMEGDAFPFQIQEVTLPHMGEVELREVEIQNHHPFAQAILDVGGKKDIERGLAGSALGGEE